jgi:CubicO group peptidase (beta-lactamase class C family)
MEGTAGRVVSTTRLAVAHDVGDHAPEFGVALAFSDYVERLVFRWSTRSAGARARWEVRTGDEVVASGDLERVPAPGEEHFFRLGLADLPRRRAYTVTVLVLSGSGEVVAGSNAVSLEWEARRPGPRFGAPIEEVLATVRERFPVPALGAAVVTRDFVQDVAAVGERKAGSGVAALVTDAWHLGSCTKPMTATLIGVLVERGLLRWSDTVADVFPEWAGSMDAHFRGVTVEHYLAHRSNLVIPEAALGALADPRPGIVERRRTFTRLCVEHAPREPDTFVVYDYQNANFVVVAAMAERVAADAAPRGALVNESWETLMSRELFRPLGMSTAGFGPPSDDRSTAALWGHRFLEAEDVFAPDNWDNVPGLGPAGRVRASLGDWARFVQLHMGSELRGSGVALGEDALQRLHTPYPTLIASEMRYGGGWVIGEAHGSLLLWHNGSNGTWYAAVAAYPELGVAFLGATNVAGADGEEERGSRAVTTALEILESDWFANLGLDADPLSKRPYARGPD